MSQSCSLHFKSLIRNVWLQLRPATIKVNECRSFNVIPLNELGCVLVPIFINKQTNYWYPYWKETKLSKSRRFLKTNVYSLVSSSYTSTPACFLLIFRGLWKCTGGSNVWNFWMFIIQTYTLYFTFCFTFTGQGANYQKRIVFRAARNKLIYEGARAKLLQLICEVDQIVPCCQFWGITYFLNVYHRVLIAVKHRLPHLTEILV